ncbi:hypothetical protein DFQ27_001785 [Actinomortierella ambigua]|uniref:Lysozyme n=1 Tax=Actinomortierella ambigua TaxID=1343610 RepID=A0A9P6QAB2_9FUNG|nr:hypothetical protein DFQ27_001785 [Actinomortierella ambigua]
MKFTLALATLVATISVTMAAACTGVNDAGIEHIKHFEGFEPNVEDDPVGNPTVGYGHKCQKKKCAEVTYKFPLTEQTATQLLKDDLPTYTSCLEKALNDKVTLNKNQWAALTSWIFNLGCGKLEIADLIKRLNNGDDPNTVAAEELPRWNKAGGKVFKGLVRRREAEVKLFKTATKDKAYPKCS